MAQIKYTVVRSKQTNELAVRINATNELVKQKENPVLFQELSRKARANSRTRQRNDCLKSLGLVKTRYGWE